MVAVAAEIEAKTGVTCGEGIRDPRDRQIRVQTTQITIKIGIIDNTTTIIMIGKSDKILLTIMKGSKKRLWITYELLITLGKI